MKKAVLLFFVFSLLVTTSNYALPNRQKNENEKEEAISAKAYQKMQRHERRINKKMVKFKKKIQKIEKKLEKRGIDTNEAVNNVWQEDNFKLGALIALGGLLLTILGVLPLLGGIFALIGGLMMVVGVALMIWVLIESY